jgi:DnaK suppressor protein
VKKPAVKKTPKKAVAPASRARPVAKKAAPARAGSAKSKTAAPAKKPVAKKAAPAKTASKAAPAGKLAAPTKGGAAKGATLVEKISAPASGAAPKVGVAANAAASSAVAKVAPPPAPAAAAAGASLAMPNGFVPRKPGRGTPKYFVAPVQAPLPPPTSRFADRFAPPRPPTRQMNKQEIDTPRQAHKADPKLANAWTTKAGRDLTDDELLAMPESEYMNEKQLEFFRMKLQAQTDVLLSNAGETTEHLREDTSIVPAPADRATIEEEHALELRTRDRERKLLKKISQSLGRIESGDYGFCDETGEPIGLGRLIARPTATLSLEAQQRRELKQKMFGD